MNNKLFYALIAGGIATIIGVLWNKYRLKGKRFAILGPKGAGKTTFLNYLRGINSNVSEGTGEEPYKSFIFTLENGKKIKIKDGKDIGGGSNYKNLYKEMIKGSDAIIIIFDVNRYLFDKKETKKTDELMKISQK